MHMYALVVLPPGSTDITTAVEQAMAPFVEDYDDTTETTTGWWDWYQIGGRYTGRLVPEYDPTEDPRNIDLERGYRPDGLKWPTEWARFDGDVQRLGNVKHLLDEHPPYTLVGAEQVLHCESWDGETWVEHGKDDIRKAIASLSDECVAVVVDYHS